MLINGVVCYTASTATLPTTIECGRTLQGHNITLYLPIDDVASLAVCEVEVFGKISVHIHVYMKLWTEIRERLVCLTKRRDNTRTRT